MSPVNRFGSGTAIVASVPVISTKSCRGSGESKLNSSEAAAPPVYSTSAPTCVGTSTANVVPAFGPDPMTRLVSAFRPAAATREAGPNTVASAEK